MGARLKVVLVEDAVSIRQRLVALIQQSGFAEVVAEFDGEDPAIAWMAEHPFDLAILDLDLRQGSGYGVLRALNTLPVERQPRIKRVVLTNYGTSRLRSIGMQLGADAFFDKSSQIEELFEFMHEWSEMLGSQVPPSQPSSGGGAGLSA